MKNDESLVANTAEKAILKQITQLEAKLRTHAEKSASEFVAGVNTARQLGLLFQELSGHEQLTLLDFQKYSARLPESLDYTFAKRCVWISHAAKEPAKSFAEARFCEQQMFTATGFLTETRRPAPHSAKVDEPFARWAINHLSDWTAEFEERLKSSPLESLPPVTLESLCERLKPFVQIYVKASERLGLRGRGSFLDV